MTIRLPQTLGETLRVAILLAVAITLGDRSPAVLAAPSEARRSSVDPRIEMPVAASIPPALAAVEERFADWRELVDRLDVATARGLTTSDDGVTPANLASRAGTLAQELGVALSTIEATGEDGRAVAAMRGALPPPSDNADTATPSTTGAESVASAGADPCTYDAPALAARGIAALSERMYACFGAAAGAIQLDGETLDRLGVLGRLATTADQDARRRLFLALAPVWRSVAGDGSPSSPYRQLLRLSAARWSAGDSPVRRNLAALGLTLEQVEPWLEQILAAWRDATRGEPIEPWDWHFAAGAVDRRLAAAVPHERLRAINDAFHRAVGADPSALGVRYDLEPRPGKDPVAYTTFGRRPRHHGDGWRPGEAWVFATYTSGGFGNLVELLHETGHGIHIQAIRTRPAFADWPDSDTFTEALGDLLALEAYEPAWQQRWLGTAAPLAESLRGKYGAIVLDTAWALFEVRLHRDPGQDPNQVWTAITREYLHVRAHPELAWWALRGQLVDAPGYMMNYALGAVLVADLRARCRELGHPFEPPTAASYAWLSERLYRFGLERGSREVVEDLLGRQPSPAALLADLARRALAPLSQAPGRLVASPDHPALAALGERAPLGISPGRDRRAAGAD